MPGDTLHVIWRPEDAHEVWARAATVQAVAAAQAPVVDLDVERRVRR